MKNFLPAFYPPREKRVLKNNSVLRAIFWSFLFVLPIGVRGQSVRETVSGFHDSDFYYDVNGDGKLEALTGRYDLRIYKYPSDGYHVGDDGKYHPLVLCHERDTVFGDYSWHVASLNGKYGIGYNGYWPEKIPSEFPQPNFSMDYKNGGYSGCYFTDPEDLAIKSGWMYRITHSASEGPGEYEDDGTYVGPTTDWDFYFYKDGKMHRRKSYWGHKWVSGKEVGTTERITDVTFDKDTLLNGDYLVRDGKCYYISKYSGDEAEVYETKSLYTLYANPIRSDEDISRYKGLESNVTIFHVNSNSEYLSSLFLYVDGNYYKARTVYAPSEKLTGWLWASPNFSLTDVSPEEKCRIAVAEDIGSKRLLVADVNLDGRPDILYQVYENYVYRTRLLLSRGEEWESIAIGEGDTRTIDLVKVFDLNQDGRIDIFCYFKNGDVGAYMQLADGTFAWQPLSVLSDEQEQSYAYAELEKSKTEANDESFSSGTGAGTISFGHGMFVKAKENPFNGSDASAWSEAKSNVSAVLTNQPSELIIVDINNDGYPDILVNEDSQTHLSYLSLPDGRYVPGTLSGEVSFCDLNGDGIKDVVVFDRANSAVLLELSQLDGSYKEKQLISNGSITGIYCHDLDGDGLVDIMLQAATSSYNSYAYFLFFKNKGDGTFKKTERALKGEYTLSKPYELDCKGRPAVLAVEYGDLAYSSGNDKYYKLRKIEWDSNFNLSESYLTYGADTLLVAKDRLNDFTDFTGDGSIDIPYVVLTGVYKKSISQYMLYSFDAQNQSPKQMGMPNVVYDKATNRIKVEWKDGSDKESASGDLDYTVAVGSSVGSADVACYEAGNSLSAIFNTGSWPVQQLYVAVRATDPNGLRGVWSLPATFVNTMPRADFVLSSAKIYTADTLTVSSVSAQPLTYYFPTDGEIVWQEGGKSGIVFKEPGLKNIEARIAGGNAVSHTVYVEPIKANLDPYGYGFPFAMGGIVFDLNGNGKTEGVGWGIEEYNGSRYDPLPTLFYSDFDYTKTDVYVFTDRNMNGLPDVNGVFVKNGTTYNWLINNDDLDFDVQSDEFNFKREPAGDYYISNLLDFNNDGLLDKYSYSEGKIYENDGDGGFIAHDIPFSKSVALFADFNRDGLIDALCGGKIYQNKGGFVFELVGDVGDDEVERAEPCLQDVNNDGYMDIVIDVDGYKKALLGDKDMAFAQKVQLPGLPLGADLNNDGVNDYYANDSILLSNGENFVGYEGWVEDAYVWKHHISDMDNDGLPDYFSIKRERNGTFYYKDALLQSRYSNTAPTAPTSVIVNQEGDEIAVSWSGATDKETPAAALRYNLSVKEKGAEGDNSYIISPLNGTRDEAKAIDTGNHQYRYATRFPIPFSRFKAGKTYEVQVQTIDGWCEHSPFSKVVEFKAAAQALISLPEKAGVGMAVPFTYSDNTGATPTINAGDGTVSGQTITWKTPGVKTVTVTAGSVRNTRQILIVDTPDLSMDIPAKVLTGTVMTVELPEPFRTADGKAALEDNKDILVTVQPNGETATMVIPETVGSHQLTATYEDDVFGRVTKTYAVEVVDFTPELSLITVENGKNRLNWDKSMSLPEASLFTGKVNVYRETSVSDNYEIIGQANIADGGFTDTDSRPDVKSDRYMITLETAYGTETAPSTVHGTVHLMLNKGMGNAINLHWSAYQGADIAQYAILVGSSPNALSEVATVSGNARSFTHERSNSATTYYAISYRLRNAVTTARKQAPAAAAVPGASNVISSDEAYAVTMVTDIIIGSSEEEMELNDGQPELHLRAYVIPAQATLATVEWTVEDGNNLATVDRNGTLHILSNASGGFVTVQAKAIDGSGTVQTVEIPVSAYTGILQPAAAASSATIRVERGAIIVENLQPREQVLVTNLQSQVVHRSVGGQSRRIAGLSQGVYIVRVGKTVKKVMVC